MIVKTDWLRERVDLSGLDTAEISERMSLHSVEIEGVSRVLSGTKLVTGHVLTCEPLPGSDHLRICTVDTGKEILRIVCGAPNITSPADVIVALPGCRLPGGVKIKKTKIRGVESAGMICSLSELGAERKYLSEKDIAGVYLFEKPVPPGRDPLLEMGFGDDNLEIHPTPNRGDLLSMYGVAYEAAAVFDRPLLPLSFRVEEDEKLRNEELIKVKTETPGCISYHAGVIKDIKIGESPAWMRSKLIAFGIRPINNVVDITNYVLALFGQPLHAFDYRLLGKSILVRQAQEGEEITTLDGVSRRLKTNDIVITDGAEPVAIAGVMGGLKTAVSEETKDIVLEAAVFDPICVRRTYKRLGLPSESSLRFEKGVDVNRTKEALDYACYLYRTLCGGRVASGNVIAGIEFIPDKEIPITASLISSYLGIDITEEETINIMRRLRFRTRKEGEKIIVSVPNRRFDISCPRDIIEEAGRIHGYDKLPVTLPALPLAGSLTYAQSRERKLKHVLRDLGLTEAINYSLRGITKEFRTDSEGEDVVLLNPIGSERRVMRRSLIPGLLENAVYAFNRKINDIAFFETGKTYVKEGQGYSEKEHLALVLANTYSSVLWRGQTEKADFFLLKGLIDRAFAELGVSFTYLKKEDAEEAMHPLRTASVFFEGMEIGFAGELHPRYARMKGLENVCVCEIDISEILKTPQQEIVYHPVSKVPNTERDLALVVSKDVSAGEIVAAIKKTVPDIIDVVIFDVYTEGMAEGKKSTACRIVFSGSETLTDEIVSGKIGKILKALKQELNATLRE